MKNTSTLFAAILFTGSFAAAQNTWVQKTNFSSTARGGACAFSVGNYGYVVTGEVSPTNFVSSGAKYDGTGGTWSSMSTYSAGGRVCCAAFSIGNKGYVGTGNSSGGVTNSFWEYNPANNTWTQKANYPVTVRFATGFSIGDYGYIAGGRNGSIYEASMHRYDTTTNSWTARASYGGGGRSGAFSFSIAGKGYMGCGQSSGGVNTSDFWEYDPNTNTWTQKANFGGTARWGTSCFTIGGKGYVGCGADNTGTVNTFYEYNPSNNTWTARASYPGQGRWYGVGFNIGNRGFFATGFQSYQSGGYTNDCWEYMPVIALSATTTPTNILCNGSCTGMATVSATGGTTPYTYSWSSGQTTASISGLCPNVYTVTVTDGGGSSVTRTVGITQPQALSALASQVSVISCNGGSGSACVTVTGGTPSYTYTWSNGQASQCATGITAGTYTVTVSDANGCSVITTLTMTQPSVLSLTTGSVGVTSGCNGSASVTASGGTGAFTYSWNTGGQTTASATNLCAGVYTVTVTDNNGCTTTATVNVPSLIGIGEAAGQDLVEVYPNPFTDKLTITAGSSATLELFNLLGEHTGTWQLKQGRNEISITGVPKGSYFIRLTEDNKVRVGRVMKE